LQTVGGIFQRVQWKTRYCEESDALRWRLLRKRHCACRSHYTDKDSFSKIRLIPEYPWDEEGLERHRVLVRDPCVHLRWFGAYAQVHVHDARRTGKSYTDARVRVIM